jgi:hypothetical protein
VLNQVQQFARATAQTIEFRHHHRVAGLQRRYKLNQLRPIGPDARDLLAVNVIAAGRLQGGELSGQVLVLRDDTGVSKGSHFALLFHKQVSQNVTYCFCLPILSL